MQNCLQEINFCSDELSNFLVSQTIKFIEDKATWMLLGYLALLTFAVSKVMYRSDTLHYALPLIYWQGFLSPTDAIQISVGMWLSVTI